MTTLRDHSIRPAAAPRPHSPALDQARQPSIVLRRPGGVGTFVDGGWWPGSLDLLVEFPALLLAVEAAGYGEIRRISFALTGWDEPPPRKVAMPSGAMVKLGGFRYQDPAVIELADGSGRRRIVIVVVPPDTESALAHRALAMAGLDGDLQRAGEILALAAPPIIPSVAGAAPDGRPAAVAPAAPRVHE